MQLRRIQKELDGYAPPALASRYLARDQHPTAAAASPGDGWWKADKLPGAPGPEITALVRVLRHEDELANLTTPKGLLLIGPPGSGKSFLINLWLNGLPTPYKARKHYSELVLEIYRAVWEETKSRMSAEHAQKPHESQQAVPWSTNIRNNWKEMLETGILPQRWFRKPNMSFSSLRSSTSQPTIAFVVAQRLLLRHWLLVFDEVQLLDVSSATLLADVLCWYWRMGGILVGTSNKVPDDLYKNGVQRERLEPFVEALKQRCPVVTLSGKDWREVKADGANGTSEWYTRNQEASFERRLSKVYHGAPSPRRHSIFGRALLVPRSSEGVCHFTFGELCEQSLGSADYLTLAATYHIVAISSIPRLTLSTKDQARRFISLIDALNEARCKLVCLAETELDLLFFSEEPKGYIDSTDVMMAEAIGETREVYRPNVSSYDTLGMAEAPAPPKSTVALETLSLFSGKEEQFAFKRALSRLKEMTSEVYWREEQWSPLPLSSRKWESLSGNDTLLSIQGDGESLPSVAVVANEPSAALRPEAPRVRDSHFWGMRND
ncbi:AFG1-like ATPase-domain-containing protein [Cristinia sonorae]|uniref:AFG1-like ATPase-domain-containing protein n=1 Tax=Cristinia sonorae TaxID=1940300 RepID=A0A8K0V019_9AGAR|nr:AFG1-like ATPase-domain-containing protein [Cristinia sonorae]